MGEGFGPLFFLLNLKMDSANTNISKKQDASTAITTSNIGKQSVNYAKSAGDANTFGGYANDITKETNATWVLANNNGKIQHRVIPTNLVLAGNGWSGFTQGTYLDYGYDNNIKGFLIDVGFADGSKFRILFSSGSGKQVHFQRMSPQGVWETYRSI